MLNPLVFERSPAGRTTKLLCMLVGCLTAAGAIATEPAETDSTSSGKKAAVLQFTGAITDVMAASLERRIDEAVAGGADIIIFDMDTPGGLVTSSIAIADIIRELKDIKTVAWVHPNAHSGGSIVACACDEIVMSRSSRIGDSQVIMGGPGGAAAVPDELRAKAYTPVLADFRTSARLNGYDQKLVEAFVIPEREVWWVENVETGERRFVFADEKAELFKESTQKAKGDKSDADSESEKPTTKDDEASAPNTSAAAATDKRATKWKLVETYYDPTLEMDVEVLQPVVRGDQLLEMSPGEAHAYGFSKAVISDESGLKSHYGLASLMHFRPSWSESLAYWLTSIYVRGFLLVLVLLGAYVEFHTPGVGVPGLVALICLAIFVGAPYLAGLANVWDILFLVVGIALLALEIFVIPGFGLAGISGVILLLIGLVATFVPDEPGQSLPIYIPTLPETMTYLHRGVVTVVTAMIASLLGMYMLSRVLPRTPVFSRIVPPNPTPSEVLTDDPYRGAARVGDIGETATPLHPAGKARFSSVLVDVVTQGEFLDAQTRVEVIERRGNRVVVRQA